MGQVDLIVLIIAILLFIGAIVVFVFIGRSIKNSKSTNVASFDEENLKLKLQLETANKELENTNKELSICKDKNEELLKDNTKLSTIASNLDEQIQNKQKEIDTLKEENKTLQKENSDTKAGLKAEKQKYQDLDKLFAEYKLSLDNLNKQNEAHLQNITNKILEEKSKKFTEQNSKEIEQLVSPLKEQINDFKKKVEDGNLKQVELHTELKTQIENVIKQTNSISEDAVNLTNALKGENKRAGNWGEHVLETILENSGLVKGIHYEAQQSVTTEENQKLIPDFVVHLPSDNSDCENNIVIDSKLSLVAYERYFNSENEEEKEKNLQDHIKSVKNHIDELANKKYENVVNGSIGFVMMFIPIEPAYLLAVQSDNSLWEYAYNKKIVLISASNMITSLRLIADIWKINTRNKEAEAMAETCGGIYDKIIGFLDTFENVGNAVKKAQDEYEKAKGQLTTGNGNVIKKLEDLRQKGIKTKTKKSLPKTFESYEE